MFLLVLDVFKSVDNLMAVDFLIYSNEGFKLIYRTTLGFFTFLTK